MDKLTNKVGSIINPATEDGNLAGIKTDTGHLDVNLSTRASESTLAGVKTQTDKLQFDGSNNLKVTSSAAAADEFSRLLRGDFKNTEQVLRDVPSITYSNASEYVGVAASTAQPTDSTWAIVRILYDANGNEAKKSILLNVIWNNRASLVW